MLRTVRGALRASHSWVTFRRLQREGFLRALRRWRTWTRVLHTAPVITRPATPREDIEVHLVCYRNDYLCAIWALKSFYIQAKVDYPVTIHIQGELRPQAIRRLRDHFPHARIITQREADVIVNPWLAARGFHRLLSARAENPYVLKLTDYHVLSEAERLITLDSDVLFFSRPSELLEFRGKHLFQRDPESTYLVSGIPGVEIAPRLNVGIMSFLREGVSLARCDEYLEHFPERRGWLEQTLYALLASETGSAECLPLSYLISLDSGIDSRTLVARHYAGSSRPLLTNEGMPFLLSSPGSGLSAR